MAKISPVTASCCALAAFSAAEYSLAAFALSCSAFRARYASCSFWRMYLSSSTFSCEYIVYIVMIMDDSEKKNNICEIIMGCVNE